MSLPVSDHRSTELEGPKEQPKSPNLKSTVKSFLSQLTPLHHAFLLVVILSQVILVLYVTRNPKLSPSSESPAQPSPEFQAVAAAVDKCDSRRIYVYDLPPMFNYELKNNVCNQTNYCDRYSNDDFGPAAKELAGIVPESILPAWYWTDVYSGDVLYHGRMLNYKCRTLEPESATAFYIPFYAGLAVEVEHHWRLEMFIKSVQEDKWWKRSNGSDHFIMLARTTWDFRRSREDDGWGSSFLSVPDILEHVVHLSVERNMWDDLEVAVPYPTVFHPRSESDIVEWQSFVRSRQRNHLFTFLGGPREFIENGLRGVLQKQCLDEPIACRQVDCYGNNCGVDGTKAIMVAFLDSDFCLQEGDTFSKHAVVECMLAGSIPVFFSPETAYWQYELFMPVDPESYSVFIHHDDVSNGTDIKRVLGGYGREEVERMREKVIEYMPRFLYAKSSQGLEETRDAFDIAIEGVLSKYKAHMERGRIGNWNEI
ncbi:hypothetical protein C3L33_18436, partial [Rhododendron williamsianum]